MATVGSLSIKLGMVTIQWDQANEKVKKDVKNLQNAFNNFAGQLNVVQRAFGSFASGFNLAGIGLAALASKSMALADNTKDMADSFGLTTPKILEYRAALMQSGVEAGNADKVIAKLYGTIAEIQTGQASGNVLSKLEKMGISLSEISKLRPDQALEVFAKGIANLDSQFEKSKALELFGGKSARTLGVDSFLEKMKQLKGVYNDDADSINKLSAANDRLKQNLLNLELAFGRILSKFTGDDGLIYSVETFKSILESAFGIYATKMVIDFTLAIYELAVALKVLKEASINLVPGMGQFLKFLSAIEALHGDNITGIEAMIKKMQELFDKSKSLEQIKTVEVTADKITPNSDNGDLDKQYYAQYYARLQLVKEEIGYQKDLLKIKLDAFGADEWATKQKLLQLKVTQDISKLEKDRQQELKGKEGKEARLINDIYDERIRLIKETAKVEQQLADKEQLIQTDFAEGWHNAYQKYMIDSKKAGESAAQAFDSLAKGLEDLLAEFFRTGKLNFKSFANMIIAEMARIQAQKAASTIMGLFGGGGGGISGFLSGLFSGGSSGGGGFSGGIDLGGFTNPIGFSFAGGGDPPVGKASLVGENGPELFIPKTAGTVIPNNSLSSMMGNQPQIVYNGPYIANMSAIDTQSSVQFLAKNKQAVWSANQSAQRSLPQSR